MHFHKRNVIEFLLVLMVNLICTSTGQAVQRSSWGQHCNETMKCDKGAWLTCQSELCACFMEDMIYDQIKAKCVSKSGERCKYFQISHPASDSIGISLYENTDCVTNAHCANGFTCSCEPGYFETIDGRCLEQREVNSSCNSSLHCLTSKFLFCIDGQCLCSEESNHIYSKSNNDTSLCVGKAGKALVGLTSCIEKTKLENGLCVCDPSEALYAGEDGHCYERKDFGEACAKDDECQFLSKFLTCVEGRCGCDSQTSIFQTFEKDRTVVTHQEIEVVDRDYNYPYGQHYNNYQDEAGNNYYYERDTGRVVFGLWLRQNTNSSSYGYINSTDSTTVTDTLTQCVGLARKPCNPENNCVKGSTCDPSMTHDTGVCACVAKFSPTSTGTCGIGHGQFCSYSTPCSDAFRCTERICNCPQINHQIYSSTHQKCIGLVSSFCAEDSDCLENSVCSLVTDTGRKQCACAAGFAENAIGKCEKAWNSTCSYKDSPPCDTVAELQCRNGRCSCPDSMTSFNSTLRKCLGLVGSRCLENDPPKCVQGAGCVQMNRRVSGRCLCQKDSEVNQEMTCLKILKNETRLLPVSLGSVLSLDVLTSDFEPTLAKVSEDMDDSNA